MLFDSGGIAIGQRPWNRVAQTRTKSVWVHGSLQLALAATDVFESLVLRITITFNPPIGEKARF